MRILTSLILILMGLLKISAQTKLEPLDNWKIDSKVQSIKLHKVNAPLSDPILNLNKRDKLKLSFDLLDVDYGDLAYEFILCDKDWNKSTLDKSYFLNGYTETFLRNYQGSINTFVQYTNYRDEIPADETEILLSGNYIVRVFPEEDPSRTILQRRFMVVESLINVDVEVEKPDNQMDSRFKQQLNFSIKYPSEISDPLVNIYTTIRQNHSWLNAMNNIKADYVESNYLRFMDRSKFVFDGNNEFRQLDLKYHRSGNLEVEKIVRENDQYHVYIKENKKRSIDQYVFKEELNGRHLIKNDDASDQDIESDYFMVHFELFSSYIFEGDVYVFGEFTDWKLLEEYKMSFDSEKSRYFLDKEVKQGMMNYMHVVNEKLTNKNNIHLIEGNNFETENDYDIVVYYRDLRTGNDRILGLYSFNSLY